MKFNVGRFRRFACQRLFLLYCVSFILNGYSPSHWTYQNNKRNATYKILCCVHCKQRFMYVIKGTDRTHAQPYVHYNNKFNRAMRLLLLYNTVVEITAASTESLFESLVLTESSLLVKYIIYLYANVSKLFVAAVPSLVYDTTVLNVYYTLRLMAIVTL